MEARARDAGCKLEVTSAPGEGTVVTIRVPVAS
jgi:signal transduction histidine kinase